MLQKGSPTIKAQKRRTRKNNIIERSLLLERKDSAWNHLQYKKAIQFGLIFVCVCCHSGLFQRGVKIFTEKLKSKIDPKVLKSSCIFSEALMDPLDEKNFYVCHNCYSVMRKNKMPKVSVKNGLDVDKIPPELQLSELESQCIARNIIFMKMKELPKTRMKSMIDRCVLVPIEDTTVMDTVEMLPRTLESSAVVPVDFKRMKAMKNVHVKGFIRPTKLFEALVTLKALGNPHYQTVIKKCLYCPREFEEDDSDMLDHVRQCLLQAQFMDPEVRDEGIEKETLKVKLRHKMTADMNKIREHLKTIARIYNSAYQEAGVDVYLEPGILDFDTGTLEKTEEDDNIFLHHFESSKNSNSKKSESEEERLFEDIAQAETTLNLKIFPPICYKIHQIMTSDMAYEKVFEYDFARVHYSVFDINYSQVFKHAQMEADYSVYFETYEKANTATKSEQKKAYDELCSQDSDASEDVDIRIFEKLRKKALIDLRATQTYEDNFRSSVCFTFENTLVSAMESTCENIFDSFFHDELKKALEAAKSMV